MCLCSDVLQKCHCSLVVRCKNFTVCYCAQEIITGLLRFEPHRRHCIVSLSKTLYPLLSTGSTQKNTSWHDCWDVKNVLVHSCATEISFAQLLYKEMSLWTVVLLRNVLVHSCATEKCLCEQLCYLKMSLLQLCYRNVLCIVVLLRNVHVRSCATEKCPCEQLCYLEMSMWTVVLLRNVHVRSCAT